MRRLVGLWLALTLVALGGCGDDGPSTVETGSAGAAQSQGVAEPINWQTLGCDQPEPLIVDSSEALETDVGLAAESVATTNGISTEEAARQLRLQEVLGERLADIQRIETGRVARTEMQRDPYFAAVVTLTGTDPISEATRDLLCRTPELEVRLGATFTQDELAAETNRFAALLDDFGPGLVGWGPGEGQLVFEVRDAPTAARLDVILSQSTDYPYTIESLDIPPLVLDPNVPFPLLDVTGYASSGVGLSGVLAIDGPCVYLDDQLVILPARETTWDAATGVLNTGGGDIRSGDSVTGGGNTYLGSLSELDQPPDPSCRLDGGVVQGSFWPADPSATPAPQPPATPPPPLPPGDLPGIRVHRVDHGDGMDALVIGVLEVGDGCVWLNGDGIRYPVVWPVLTFGRAEPPEIVLPTGEIARPGDRIEGGGGYVNAATVTSGLGLNPFPDQCIYSGEAAVFNAGSLITVARED